MRTESHLTQIPKELVHIEHIKISCLHLHAVDLIVDNTLQALTTISITEANLSANSSVYNTLCFYLCTKPIIHGLGFY